MAYTTIDDPTQYFNTLLWSGNSANRSITGVGFSPDWVWIKCRSDSAGHVSFDTARGASVRNVPNSSAGDTTTNEYGFVTAFGSDGFTVTGGNQGGYAHGDTNLSGRTYVGWNWRGSDSNAVSNTNGSITSTVSANTTAGFSVLTYTGNGNSTATVGHGLGKAPAMIFVKGRDRVTNWNTWHKSFADNKYVTLDATYALSTDTTTFPDASGMTSTVFKIGSGSWVNGNNNTNVAYCFAEIQGYSKFGSYTGNGNTDGPFIYTGFKPAFLLVKNVSNTGEWGMFDSKRNTFNVVNARIEANTSGAEYSGDSNRDFDFLSNGIKVRNGSAQVFNTSGQTHIYMALAEHPFVSSEGVPVTAR